LFKTQDDDSDDSNDEGNFVLPAQDYVDFSGLKLKKRPTTTTTVEPCVRLVFVDTTKRNLNKIVMSVITDNCIVVEGALSTGKTTLVEYLAEQTGSKLIKYQMDEFMDSKVNKHRLSELFMFIYF
jgi:midasin (ATPase involved in ribosome maturation)